MNLEELGWGGVNSDSDVVCALGFLWFQGTRLYPCI